MNVRYLIEGAPAAIAFFIGIYDVLDNIGLQSGQTAAALATCPDNACTVWGSTYELHPSWGTAFHDRFLNGTEFRTNLLYAHLTFNSIVFVLMHIQLWRPGTAANATLHAYLGRVSFACLTIGTVCAIWLSASHGSVDEYGGNLSMYGFWSMSLFVYGCAVMGVLAIRRGDVTSHRIWMIRFAEMTRAWKNSVEVVTRKKSHRFGGWLSQVHPSRRDAMSTESIRASSRMF